MRLLLPGNAGNWQHSDMKDKYSMNAGKRDAEASFLPAYHYSPWKEGRTIEEQEALLLPEEMEIADGVEEIGNYTFYGCGRLRSLSFTDSLKRIGGGSFTGCSALRELHVLMGEGAKSCIMDVAAETFHEVFVTITFRETGDRAKLVFPDYYEEGVENTPARILETHFHGSGYRYRQCFTEKRVDYHRYDSLFEVAKVYEKPEILIPMAMGRLMYPRELGEEAGNAYAAYVREHLKEAGAYFLKRREWHSALCYLAEHAVQRAGEMELLLGLASGCGMTEAVSLLMEEKRKRFGRAVKSFEF